MKKRISSSVLFNDGKQKLLYAQGTDQEMIGILRGWLTEIGSDAIITVGCLKCTTLSGKCKKLMTACLK